MIYDAIAFGFEVELNNFNKPQPTTNLGSKLFYKQTV